MTRRQRLAGAALGAAAFLAFTAADAATNKSVPLPRPRPAAANAPKAGHVFAIRQSAPAVANAAKLAAAAAPAAIKPPKPTVPLAFASTASTSASDIAAVKRALELARKGKSDDARAVGKTVSDPLARKLIEWLVLRFEDGDFDFKGYSGFVAENPGWSHIPLFRRRAEAALWQNKESDATVRAFFAERHPESGKGKLALARALLNSGDRAGAQQLVREAWRNDELSAAVERQVLDMFGPLLNGGDHKARMDRRFYAEDVEGALRAANRLGGTQIAIAKARAAMLKRNGWLSAQPLLDAVPQEARNDPTYVIARVQWLRRKDKAAEAAQLLLSMKRDPAGVYDADDWWVERRLILRRLLDDGDFRTAYRIAAEAVMPDQENYKVDHLFTAGWIALRYLNDPTTAAGWFARIPQVTQHPTGLARAYYWQGRAAEAFGRKQEARAFYERAGEHATAYYGQLARGRLGLPDTGLRAPPQLSPDERAKLERLEIIRAVEILYAIDERDLIVSISAEISDRLDPRALIMLAETAARRGDARALLHIGKGGIARGLPFDVYAFPIEGLPSYKAVGPKVEPHITYAIARQESGFNQKVVSIAKAMGFMQVTPAAGKYLGKKFSVPYDEKRLLSDPVYNMQMGNAELGDLLEYYRGSYILTFAGYNAGRGRCKEWIEKRGDPRDANVDPVDWVERIPIAETRNYVQRVMENLQVYRQLFGGSSKLMIEADIRRGAQ